MTHKYIYDPVNYLIQAQPKRDKASVGCAMHSLNTSRHCFNKYSTLDSWSGKPKKQNNITTQKTSFNKLQIEYQVVKNELYKSFIIIIIIIIISHNTWNGSHYTKISHINHLYKWTTLLNSLAFHRAEIKSRVSSLHFEIL